MSIHVCKQCGDKFEYCRACVFRPIRYKDLGFCSKGCYEASKNKIEEVVPIEDVEVVVIEEDTSTPIEEASEYPHFFTDIEITPTEEARPRKKKVKSIEEVIEEKEENEEDENKQDNGATIRPD